jgi:Phage tail protein
MTSPVAVVGLTWDGYDIQRSDLDVFLEITEGLDELPELRARRDIIPFRHGQRPAAPYANRRPIVLTGLISGPSATERSGYRGYVDEVKESFSPLRSAPGTLVATLEDGTTRWIKAMPLDARFRPIVPGASNTSIELVADDPFWYSAYGTVGDVIAYDAAIIYDSSLHLYDGATGALGMDTGIEMDDDYLMDSGGEIIVTPPTTEVTFDSMGTADVERIRIRFVGPSTGSVGVHNLSTSSPVGFSIARTLAAGEEIVVNNYARTAKLDGVTNVRGDMTLRDGNRHNEYLRLLPGSQTLRILGAPAEARITFFATWL